ncbi:hypothetical protein O7605_25585 [Verrucosispora sp. WMMA2121]|uniref:hypothetical protein n=1 Tax=Verrucosispora sp. WMMA2121 TaxID=3015164 RepID=UPI0022B7368C|nr:hypothetical protein [Verrucosispora sp. WMMA2121]MCZ7422878.1 hypothetical protein [Verrucosispora sp. WMMA2121]
MLLRRWRRPFHSPRRGQYVLADALAGNARARARIDRWWAAGGADRDRVWRGAWFLLSAAYFRFGNHERPEQVAPALEFLLEPDPTSGYLPRVRLTACLPQTAADPPQGLYEGDPYVRRLVQAALAFPDLELRRRLAELMSVTDQPGLLDALEIEFRSRARLDSTYVGAAPPGHETLCNLWYGGEPTALLRIVCANPHLPRPPADPGDVNLVLLPLVKDRLDLLPAFDQAALAQRLLKCLDTWLPDEVHDRCRRALRELSARDGVAVVCKQAMLGDTEATAAVRAAGHRPAHPAWLPLFLLLTRQFAAYRGADPEGRVLQLACFASEWGSADEDVRDELQVEEEAIIDRVLHVLDTDLPDDVAASVRGSLRDLGPSGSSLDDDFCRRAMRRALLTHAVTLVPEAVAAVVDAGYLPEDDDESALPVLFLTEQFERYDGEDPDGTRLRAILATQSYHYEHEHFRTVARRNGRPDPWPAPAPRTSESRSSTRHATTWPSSFGHF